MFTCLIISLVFGSLVVWTGPAFEDERRRLHYWRNYPKAKALPKPKGSAVEDAVVVGTPLA